MAIGVLVIGSSGTGKTTSGRNMPVENTFYINVANKPLPYKTDKKYTKVSDDNPPGGGKMLYSSNADTINRAIDYAAKDSKCKYVIIDDWQYSSASEFMDAAEQKGYDKFTKMGKNIWEMAKMPSKINRDDLIIYYLTHSEESFDSTGNKFMKAKTVGESLPVFI